jgi:hypothetical protein
MPGFMIPLLAALSFVLEALAFRLAIGFGLGVASFIGVSSLVGDAAVYVASYWAGLPAQMLAMAYLMKIDLCINLLFSAYTARLSLVGMTALGGLSKAVQLPPPA